jgi:hypothetical protein
VAIAELYVFIINELVSLLAGFLSILAEPMRQNAPTCYITLVDGDFVPETVLSQGVEVFSQCTHLFDAAAGGLTAAIPDARPQKR